MTLLQIWLLRAALVALALLCMTFGALTIRKGLRGIGARNMDNEIHGGAAESVGAYAVSLGGLALLVGFFLLYCLLIF